MGVGKGERGWDIKHGLLSLGSVSSCVVSVLISLVQFPYL